MVAKIYDPLYYGFIGECGYKQDVICDADGDCCREAVAYAELQKSAAAKEVTPAWHMYLASPCPISTRIPCLCAFDRPSSKVIDAECVISHENIRHGDYNPRNIILSDIDPADTELTSETIEKCLKVKVIDFNIAEVLTHPLYEYRECHLGTSARVKLPSPVVRYSEELDGFRGWVSLEDADRWLWQQFHDSERYRPVVWGPSASDTEPRYADEGQDDSCSTDSGTSMDKERAGQANSNDKAAVA
ncbi:hypothetical protein BKA63DRAFT_583639 [Paraphoma chrysanthemicola]|nr:hypothetical protein BKA63DRAFT_583639 [Paraphoma chrysanthemicola]